METITTIQYLTSLQGALRDTVAFSGFILFFVGQSKQSHAPAFKYLQYFIATLSVWGFFGCLFYLCPTPQLLPIISPFIYASISFVGPIFMLFCISYTMPKKVVDRIEEKIQQVQKHYPTNISVGTTTAEEYPIDYHRCIKTADELMYKKKIQRKQLLGS